LPRCDPPFPFFPFLIRLTFPPGGPPYASLVLPQLLHAASHPLSWGVNLSNNPHPRLTRPAVYPIPGPAPPHPKTRCTFTNRFFPAPHPFPPTHRRSTHRTFWIPPVRPTVLFRREILSHLDLVFHRLSSSEVSCTATHVVCTFFPFPWTRSPISCLAQGDRFFCKTTDMTLPPRNPTTFRILFPRFPFCPLASPDFFLGTPPREFGFSVPPLSKKKNPLLSIVSKPVVTSHPFYFFFPPERRGPLPPNS